MVHSALLVFLFSFWLVWPRTLIHHQSANEVVPKSYIPGEWSYFKDHTKIMRPVGSSHHPRLDPFLALEFFSTMIPGGFVDHPLKGLEQITYLVKGKMVHEDSLGNSIQIGEKGAQLIVAGSGMASADVPKSRAKETVGFNILLSLEKEKKKQTPTFAHYEPDQIPLVKKGEIEVRVICGKGFLEEGPLETSGNVVLLDVLMRNGDDVFVMEVEEGWVGLVFKYEGFLEVISGNELDGAEPETITFEAEAGHDQLVVRNKANSPGKFIVLLGEPIHETVFQHHKIVVDSMEELQRTFQDLSSKENGFENLKGWESKIKKITEL